MKEKIRKSKERGIIMEKQKLKENKGITLIALVITILVLLILAGVSIAMLTGDNGIIKQATNAKEKTEEAQEEENIKLAIMASSIEDNGYAEVLNADSFIQELKNVFGDQEINVEPSEYGSFLITVNDRKYYVSDDKTVINNDNIVEIGTIENLEDFRDDVNNGNTYEGKVVLLTNDITVNGDWEPIGYYPVENSDPSDETNSPFKGTFDGEGYEIDGININTSDKVQGIFGLVNNGKVLNLTLGENSNINGGIATGGIVGYAYNGAIVSNCYNKGTVSGSNMQNGGIVGIALDNCNIINCHNLGIVTGEKNVGGIAGNLLNSTLIQNCSNSGKVTGESEVGGITGTGSNDSKINQCFNKGIIESSGGNIESGNSNIGGIIGLNLVNVLNCYNAGTIISASNNAGGLVGLNRGILENSYNVGNIESSATAIGAIAGNNNEFFDSSTNITYSGKVYNCYSLQGILTNIIGTNNSIIGNECSYKRADELKGLINILGKSFKEDSEKVNEGYPILNWQR